MQDILALDFDGVICDSAGEMAQSSWRAARKLWPERYAAPVSQAHIAAFREARPVIKTGFESILLTEMLVRGEPKEEILRGFQGKCRDLMQELDLELDPLIACFGAARDEWIAVDLVGWIAAHDYYPGVVEALNASLCTKVIITTKQRRFAAALVKAANLDLPETLIFGLEDGRKGDVLCSLAGRYDPCRLHFVEDRLRTLQQVQGLKAELNLRLYFAAWGFTTAAERRAAGELRRICRLELSTFAQFVRNPADFSG